MNVDIDGEVVTKAEHLAGVLTGNATSRMIADARPVLARLPVFTLAEVDAMATMGSKSRNAMLIHLLDVGLEEVRRQLTEERAQLLNEETTQRLVSLIADTAGQSTEEA